MKFSLFVLYVGQINRCRRQYFCPKLYLHVHVLTMAAAFQVIFEADEDDNRPRLKQIECSETGIFVYNFALY